MRYRTIGSSPATRREVSVLSLGAMLMGSAFGELLAAGEVGLLGVSNHWAWRVERARPGWCRGTCSATCGPSPG